MTLTGRTLGEFVITEKLGEGGFGEVYRAEQPVLGREAVIKVLHSRHHASPAVTQRFLQEARLASRLDHPYAAHVYAFGAEADGVHWIAMELVRGTPLDRVLATQGRLPLERLAALLDRLCEVVHTAHEQGIVHRDLKPGNVMVIARAGRMLPKLLDLGIAKVTGEPTFDETPAAPRPEAVIGGITRRGDVVGSPRYMAPEQWVNGAIDGRADVYALGILTWEALTGRHPFPAETVGAMARAHASAPVPPLGEGFPPALDAVFARAMAKRAADRFPTALELAAAFRAAAGLGAQEQHLPGLAGDVRDLWLAEAPQPLAESIAVLDGARNAHQALQAADDLARVLTRWLALCALGARHHLGDSSPTDGARRLIETLVRRQPVTEDWLALTRELLRPHARRPDAHPLPELVRLFAQPGELFTALGGEPPVAAGDEAVRARLTARLGALARLMRALAFVCEYPLVVAAGGEPHLWMGMRRSPPRLARLAPATRLVDGQPTLLDGDGRPLLSLWPLAQAAAPAPGSAPELFLLDGRGRMGARLVAFPRGFEREDEGVWDWLGQGLLADETAGVAVAQPYRGLASFSSDDAALFFGRERETEAFVNRLRTTSFLAVVGASGAGKSSFLQAGVLPRLPAGWRAVTMRPGSQPLAALAARLDEAGSEPLVLVVDQLEELITLCADPAERRAFAAQLDRAADQLRVVCTLRDDFLARVGELGALRERLTQGLHLLATPGEDDLLRIVTLPAERAGFGFDDPELPSRMVAEVAGRPGALALLSFTAARLWEERDRHFKVLTGRAYEAMGGVGGALARHAEDTLAGLGQEEQRLVRTALLRLVTADGTRAVLGRDELEQILGPAGRPVLDKLIAARLLVASEGPTAQIEIIHEALLTGWPRLVAWLRENAEGARLRDQLRVAARQWHERGRPPGLLWRGEALAEHELWRSRHPGPLPEVEEAFGAASRAEAARGRRGRRVLVGAIIGGLVIALAVTVTFGRRASEAQARAEAGLIRQYQEQGRQLLLADDALRAYPYLVEAYRRGGPNPVLMFLLGRAGRLLDRQEHVLRHQAQVNDAAFSPDGTLVATASDDGTAGVWEVASGKRLAILRHDGAVLRLAFSPDGSRVATASHDQTAAIWSVSSGRRLATLRGHTAPLLAIEFNEDGSRLATGGHDGGARLWDGTTGAPLARLGGDERGVTQRLGFLRDGRVVTARAGGAIRVWSPAGEALGRLGDAEDTSSLVVGGDGETVVQTLRSGRALMWKLPAGALPAAPAAELVGHSGPLYAPAVDVGSGAVLTPSEDGTARLWRGGASIVLRGHEGTVFSALFDAASERIATASADGTVRIWEAATGAPVATLRGHLDRVFRARFAPDGQRLVSAGFDGTARVWSLTPAERVAKVQAHEGEITTLLRHGGRLVTSGGDGRVRVWRTGAAIELERERRFDEPVMSTVPAGPALDVFLPSGAHRLGPGGEVTALPFAAEGDRILHAAASGDRLLVLGERGAVGVWARDVPRRLALWETRGLTYLLPAGEHVVALAEAQVSVFAIADGALLRSVSHPPRVSDATLHGGRLYTAGFDRLVRVWRVADGTLETSLDGHTERVSAVLASPDGRRVISGGFDGTVRVWDAARGDLLATFREPGWRPTFFSLAGDDLFVGDQHGGLTRWTLEAASGEGLEERLRCKVSFTLVQGRLVPAPADACRP